MQTHMLQLALEGWQYSMSDMQFPCACVYTPISFTHAVQEPPTILVTLRHYAIDPASVPI